MAPDGGVLRGSEREGRKGACETAVCRRSTAGCFGARAEGMLFCHREWLAARCAYDFVMPRILCDEVAACSGHCGITKSSALLQSLSWLALLFC